MKTTLQQAAPAILMVRPACFGYNPETAISNSFQAIPEKEDVHQIQDQAKTEFDKAVELFTAKEIEVFVVEDTPEPRTPDAIFPNNWISFHENGLVVTYPMEAENRRTERRPDDFIKLLESRGYDKKYHLDLSPVETKGQFLEGTGSIIFDYVHKKAYACKSSRTNVQLLNELCAQLHYEVVVFNAYDRKGKPIYHTNVVMALAEKYVVIGQDRIPLSDWKMLEDQFKSTGHEIVSLDINQVESFAGNMLQVANKKGETFLVMSSTAFKSLTPDQKDIIEKYDQILPVDIPTIEKYGGGSIRCMMASMNLPKK